MNANNANALKFLAVQLQNHVNLGRQTGQLLQYMMLLLPSVNLQLELTNLQQKPTHFGS